MPRVRKIRGLSVRRGTVALATLSIIKIVDFWKNSDITRILLQSPWHHSEVAEVAVDLEEVREEVREEAREEARVAAHEAGVGEALEAIYEAALGEALEEASGAVLEVDFEVAEALLVGATNWREVAYELDPATGNSTAKE